MKSKAFLNRASFINTLDFIIAPTGIDREQASIALHTIVRLCKDILRNKHPH